MRKSTSRKKVPEGGYVPPLQRLLSQAEDVGKATGSFRGPSGPWLDAAEHYLRCQSVCRPPRAEETPEWVIAFQAEARGLSMQIEGDVVVVEIPGWTPVETAKEVQPGILD